MFFSRHITAAGRLIAPAVKRLMYFSSSTIVSSCAGYRVVYAVDAKLVAALWVP